MSAPESERLLDAEMPSLTESVAKLVTVTDQIGHARHLLEQAGHKAVLAKNRIDVEDLVTAQYVGGEAPRWVVYSIDGSGPEWVVGVQVATS